MARMLDKVVMITGGGGGLGTAIAKKLSAEGAQLVVADLNLAAAKRAADECVAGAHAIEIDAGDVESISAAIEATVKLYGRIDVLHNNAAITDTSTLEADTNVVDIEFDLFDRVMQVNLRGYLAGCKYAIPHMIKNGGGVIINTSSGMGAAGLDSLTAYSCSKAAILQLTRQVATAFGKQNIRCNAISPYVILSEKAKSVNPPELLDIRLRHTLTPYLGEPRDIADLVCFLASDESRFITGQNINIDGGAMAHYPDVADMRDWTG